MRRSITSDDEKRERERERKGESYVTVRARVRFVWEFLAVRCGSLRSVSGEGEGAGGGRMVENRWKPSEPN